MTRRKCRPQPGAALSTTTTLYPDSTAATDPLDGFDERVIAQVDWSIWRALRAGDFRLAVQCRRCGRWLTDYRSRRAHLGPRCARADA